MAEHQRSHQQLLKAVGLSLLQQLDDDEQETLLFEVSIQLYHSCYFHEIKVNSMPDLFCIEIENTKQIIDKTVSCNNVIEASQKIQVIIQAISSSMLQYLCVCIPHLRPKAYDALAKFSRLCLTTPASYLLP